MTPNVHAEPAVNQMFENNDKVKSALEALTESIARWTDKGDQVVTAIPGLSLFRRDASTPPTSYMYEQSICLIAQGTKRVVLGDDVYAYDPHHFLITSVDLPVAAITRYCKLTDEC